VGDESGTDVGEERGGSLGYEDLAKLVGDNYEAVKEIVGRKEKEKEKEEEKEEGEACDGRRIYVYDVPAEFNTDLAAECTEVGRGKCKAEWGCLFCGGLENEGLGERIEGNASGGGGGGANASVRLVPASAWFRTHQFALEPIVHARMRRYECRTADASRADAFYVPYYVGQDVALSGKCHAIDVRDR
jgi:hypothetical protein